MSPRAALREASAFLMLARTSLSSARSSLSCWSRVVLDVASAACGAKMPAKDTARASAATPRPTDLTARQKLSLRIEECDTRVASWLC